MKKIFKLFLILATASLPLALMSCFEHENKTDSPVFSNQTANEKYKLLKEFLKIPLVIEQTDIANDNFSILLNENSRDLNVQNFLTKEKPESIRKKLLDIAKSPKFKEIVQKKYLGTSYFTASEFLDRWKQSQEKYLRSANLRQIPDFVPELFGSGFAANNIELTPEFLVYKIVNVLAKIAIKSLPENPKPQPNAPTTPTPNPDSKPQTQAKNDIEKPRQFTNKNLVIPVPIQIIVSVLSKVLDAVNQPLSKAYWWNYNYEILSNLRNLFKKSFEADLDLPIFTDPDFEKKLELTRKLDKFAIIGKDGRKYKVQPRAFFLTDEKTYVDDSTNQIKDAIYRIYWIVDSNPDENEVLKTQQTTKNDAKNNIQSIQNSSQNTKISYVLQRFLQTSKNNFSSINGQKTNDSMQNNTKQPQATPIQSVPENQPPIIQGPQPKPEVPKNDGLVDDFDKYKFTDKIQKYKTDNSNNFSYGGLYSATLLELLAAEKKQDKENPQIFSVERRINISGFLKKGEFLDYQPIDLAKKLKKLTLIDKYYQFFIAVSESIQSGRQDLPVPADLVLDDEQKEEN
ncbi:hypothetical protein [Mycoplasma sp. 'Moose RK']|uniref:hypothetical protein n=1 Tax=Mycoplasma sp. 'Moose RK' TaxID=2780095 RepID=UPI0018C30D7C|nr:hypothetical protein [Mycoplasma sp. 'Moose RK']MBG0730800.1 hypothetical protein [Mycoplasma sp. 'Moose RK']